MRTIAAAITGEFRERERQAGLSGSPGDPFDQSAHFGAAWRLRFLRLAPAVSRFAKRFDTGAPAAQALQVSHIVRAALRPCPDVVAYSGQADIRAALLASEVVALKHALAGPLPSRRCLVSAAATPRHQPIT